MKNTMYPIINEKIIDLVGKKLKETSNAYFIIFNLMLETGMPLSTCISLRCCDIDKNAVTFHPTHKHVTRTENISDTLQKEIAEYLGSKHDESLAFPRKNDSTMHIHYRSFLESLENICNLNAISPVITSQSIRKTYIYRLLINGEDFDKIYSLTSCRSIKDVYEYLGLELPDQKDRKYFSRESVKSTIQKQNLINEAKRSMENVIELLDKIDKNVSYDKQFPYEYYVAVMHFLNSINEATSIFKNDTSHLT